MWIGSRERENATSVTAVHGALECGLEVGRVKILVSHSHAWCFGMWISRDRILHQSLLCSSCMVLWDVDKK